MITLDAMPWPVALRLRLREGEGFCVNLDDEAAILLREALYDDASCQSSSQACDLIWGLLDDQRDAPERTISQEVAADFVRGIDRVSELYGPRPALVELRAFLQRPS
jgi:hypothetical protein